MNVYLMSDIGRSDEMNTINTQGAGLLQSLLTQQQIGLAVLNKTQDVQQQQADAALKLLDAVVQVSESAQQTQHGSGLDLTA